MVWERAELLMLNRSINTSWWQLKWYEERMLPSFDLIVRSFAFPVTVSQQSCQHYSLTDKRNLIGGIWFWIKANGKYTEWTNQIIVSSLDKRSASSFMRYQCRNKIQQNARYICREWRNCSKLCLKCTVGIIGVLRRTPY